MLVAQLLPFHTASVDNLLLEIFKMVKVNVFIGVLSIIPIICEGDFIYTDFNQTLGLVFNGNASTSDCRSRRVSKISEVTSRGGYESVEEIMTIDGTETDYETGYLARFGHRSNVGLVSPDTGCKRRLRLTSSSPSQAGSVFYEKRLPVVSNSYIEHLSD